MATIGGVSVTFADMRKRQAPNGTIDHIIEVLQQSNPIMEDIRWMAGNLPTGNMTTQRTSLPRGHLRQINRGIPASKSTTKQVTDTCCLIEARSEVDVALIGLQADKEAYRRSEDDAFVAGLTQQVAGYMFYGDSDKNMDEFNGFAKRYSQYGGKQGDPSYQVINAGGTKKGLLSSAYLVGWGDQGACGIYPKFGYAGLKYEDKGEEKVVDADGNSFYALVSLYDWKPGLSVKDPGMVSAVRNIDTKTLSADSATSEQKRALIDHFIRAKNRMRNLNIVNPVWYVSPEVYTFLETYMVDKTNVFVTRETLQDSGPLLRLGGIPVKKEDALMDNEDAVTEAK